MTIHSSHGLTISPARARLKIVEPDKRFLNRFFEVGNLIREITKLADRIARETGIDPFRAHLGDPSAETHDLVLERMRDSFAGRPIDPGYTHHQGNQEVLERLMRSVEIIAHLPPGLLNATHATVVPGNTGGLNLAFEIFDRFSKRGPVVLTDPGYTPWKSIAKVHRRPVITCHLSAENNYIPTYEQMREAILEGIAKYGPKVAIPVVLNFPSNPNGTTLNAKQAKALGEACNRLAKEFPNVFFLEEWIYIGTIAKHLGINLPSQHMDGNALGRTAILISNSKVGLAPERAGVAVALSEALALLMGGCSGTLFMGNADNSLIGAEEVTRQIAYWGMQRHGAKERPGMKPDSLRYVIGDYYEQRRRAAAQPLLDLRKFGLNVLPQGIPKAAYYLFPVLEDLRGLAVPDWMREGAAANKVVLPDRVETADDLQTLLNQAWTFGVREGTLAPGHLFTADPRIWARLAAVQRSVQSAADVGNSLSVICQGLIGRPKAKIRYPFRSPDQLRRDHPVLTQPSPASPARLRTG